MNFSAHTKAWIMLICLVLGTGIGTGTLAYNGGAHWVYAIIVGLGTAATNVYTALTKSPREKAIEAETQSKPPFKP